MNCLPRNRQCISSLTLADIGIRRPPLPTLLVIAFLFSHSIASRRVASVAPHSALFALTSLRFVAGWRALSGGGRLGRSVGCRFYSLRIRFVRSLLLAFAYSSLRYVLGSCPPFPAPLRSLFYIGATAPNPVDARLFVPRFDLIDLRHFIASFDT